MKKCSLLVMALLLASCLLTSEMPEEVIAPQYVLRSEIKPGGQTPIHKSKLGNFPHPDWLSYVDDIDNFVIAYPADYPHEHPIFMSEMSMERMTPETSCSPSLTGVFETALIDTTNGQAAWGKVDAFDAPNSTYPHEAQPLCRPPILKWDYDEKLGVMRLSNDAAYALCAEKNGKTVFICISQVTDNPELARQIFETFRWTE